MGRTGSRTASRLRNTHTHTKQAGLAHRGHAGAERGDAHRIRTVRDVPDLTRQTFKTTDRTHCEEALKGRSRWTDTEDRHPRCCSSFML